MSQNSRTDATWGRQIVPFVRSMMPRMNIKASGLLLISLHLAPSHALSAAARSQSLNDIKKILQSLENKKKNSRVHMLVPPPLPKKPVSALSQSKSKSKQTRTSKNLSLSRLKKSPFRSPLKGSLRRYTYVDDRPQFDLPVTYNRSVRKWVKHFQKDGRRWYKTWLERSFRYLPLMTETLAKKGLPKDLAYVAMIESGFSPRAVSSAKAVGYWQFIKPTANRYGLQTTWWLDERRDFKKSTLAAASYLEDLYRMFNSWYLAAAAYNMGEGRTQRLIDKYKTKNFWELARQKDFPDETREYIPKLIAAMLIAKAPGLYGFNKLDPHETYSYEYFQVPGGTDLHVLAKQTGVDRKLLLRLNPELTQGYIPKSVSSHRIRIPRGHIAKVSQFVRTRL